jgi:Trk K+ transport system NAD-binding subunit
MDEASIRKILLDAKPVAFVSMLQEDSLNFNACQLMLGSFDVPRCIVKCIDPAWTRKFAILQPRTAVCFVQHSTTSVRNTLNQFVQSAQSAVVLLGDDPSAGVLRVTMTGMEHGVRIRDLKIPEDVQVLGIQRELDLSGPTSSCAASADTRRSGAMGGSEIADANSICGEPEMSCRSLDSSRSCASMVGPVGAAALGRPAAPTALKRTFIMPHGHTVLQLNDEVTICGRPDSLASITGLRRGKVVLQTN